VGLGHVPRPRNFMVCNKLHPESFLADCHRQSSPSPPFWRVVDSSPPTRATKKPPKKDGSYVEGPVGQRASPFSIPACSEQAPARVLTPPNPRHYDIFLRKISVSCARSSLGHTIKKDLRKAGLFLWRSTKEQIYIFWSMN